MKPGIQVESRKSRVESRIWPSSLGHSPSTAIAAALVICGGCTSAPMEVPREKVRIESFNEYHRRIGDLGERWIVTSNRQYYVKTNAPVNP